MIKGVCLLENSDFATVYTGTYRGFLSVIAESVDARIEIVPELGAKIVSIVYKPTGKEWLLDSGNRLLQQPEYGSTFVDWDMSGWDECFPTIESCMIGIDRKIQLPDHGELWSLR